MGIAENVFKVRGQRSRSYVYKCVNAIMAEAYTSTVWRQGLLVHNNYDDDGGGDDDDDDEDKK